MTASFSKKNMFLIPIVILFGVNMFLAATNVTRWAAEASLRAFNQTTLDTWTARLQPKVDEALSSAEGDLTVGRLTALIDARILSESMAGYELFDASGTIVATVLSPAEVAAVPGSPAARVEAGVPLDDQRRLLGVDLALDRAGTPIGRLRIYVDQSDVMQLFHSSHQFVEGLSAVFLFAAVSILIFIIWSRVREQAKSDAHIRHLAHHDALTGLPNREHFMERFGRAVERARKGEDLIAVLCLDVDQFKRINDTLGHSVGDELLKEFADRLRTHTRTSDLICRIGGDEFMIVLTGLKAFDKIAPFANRLCEALAEPYDIAGNSFVSSSSIGVSISPNDGVDPDELLKFADLALYRAKADGRNMVRFYEPSMDEIYQRRIQLGDALGRALENGEFKLYYQPQIDMDTGATYGKEALVRWYHPIKGTILPDDFIAIAEETGQIIPISEWILETACREAMGWEDDLTVAVNMSPVQFKTGSVADLVARTLEATGLPAHRLELEITESLLMSDTQAVMKDLCDLKALGVGIVMDDFGTGYSSLSYLASFPFDKIKIDRSFIERLDTDAGVDAIVSSIINLSRQLGVVVAAEGVETKQQELTLMGFGCNVGQGFLYARPAPALAGNRHVDPQTSIIYPRFRGDRAPAVTLETTADDRAITP